LVLKENGSNPLIRLDSGHGSFLCTEKEMQEKEAERAKVKVREFMNNIISGLLRSE